MKIQEGKPVELGIQLGHRSAEQDPNQAAEQNTEQTHRQDQLEVMPADRRFAIAERLEDTDLLALGFDHASREHVQQKRSHAQKDRRDDLGDHGELV